MSAAIVERVVKSLLYEGYLLYPYRASSLKNRHRFNFGVLYPRAYAEGRPGSDAWTMRMECLAAGDDSAAIEISVRFLRMVERNGGRKGEEFWQEAEECRIDLPSTSLGALRASHVQKDVDLAHENEGEPRQVAGTIRATVAASAEEVTPGTTRIGVRITNTFAMTSNAGIGRDEALAHSLVSTHIVLGIGGGAFLSLLEPPANLREAAAACRNEGVWPVLIGDPGQAGTLLASPIILYDYPSIAPESPNDLYDSTEIDEILTLRILTMTEQEKEEARQIEQARRILEHAESLGPEQFAKLHGAWRGSGGLR